MSDWTNKQGVQWHGVAMMKRVNGTCGWKLVFLGVFLCAGLALASSNMDELNELVARVQSMSHGYFAASEWTRLLGDLDVLSARAEQAHDWQTVLEARLLKATVLDDLLNDPERSLAVVQQTRQKLKSVAPVPGYGRLYVREAQIYGKLGDEAAIGRLIEEFKRSPFYDPQPYSFTGGQGRDVPLVLTRPRGRGDDSLTVTAMEVARQRARSAAGRAFPDFEMRDTQGRLIRSADCRGKVVLVDFWIPSWTPWQRDLPRLVRLYNELQQHGFEIIGISLERNAVDFEGYLQRNGMTWPQVVGDMTLARRLGIFGDATNYLLDQNGRVIGRNLRGADLTQAVRAAMGMP